MKNKLRHLTTATLVLSAIAVAYLLAEPSIEKWKAEREAAAVDEQDSRLATNLRLVSAANIPVDAAGDRQLLLAIARLEQRGSVTARLQHEAHVTGLRLDGRGEYLQQGRGTQRQVRWLLESQHEGVRSSLLQSSDGDTLWTDRNTATGRTIQRVDLWQLRRLSKLTEGDADEDLTDSAPFAPQLAANFGGLPMLLESLRMHFEFTAPGVFRAPDSLQLGSQPVLGLMGRWRPESLATVLCDAKDPSSDEPLDYQAQLEQRLARGNLPKHMPMNVLILLGQHDLFPYLIEFRSIDDELASEQLAPESLYQLSRQPLARLQFFDVVFDRSISTVEFIYEPPEEPAWIEGTDAYVDRMRRLRSIQLARQDSRRLATGPDGARR